MISRRNCSSMRVIPIEVRAGGEPAQLLDLVRGGSLDLRRVGLDHRPQQAIVTGCARTLFSRVRPSRMKACNAYRRRRPCCSPISKGDPCACTKGSRAAVVIACRLSAGEQQLTYLGPLRAKHAVEDGVAPAAVGHRVEAAQSALLDRADVAQPLACLEVEHVGLELDALHAEPLEGVLQHQELRPPVDALAAERLAQPGPADLQPSVRFGQIARLMLPARAPDGLVGDVVDHPPPAR